MILTEPPSAESGEITDKRSVNQRLATQRRAREVALLYAEPPLAAAILPAADHQPDE
jgi:feruloyl-CoA synthase